MPSETGRSSGDEEFMQLLTQSQSRLYSYIFSLLPFTDASEDVLQETNLVLWRKSVEFAGGNFLAWAFRVAHFQVLAYRRDKARDRKFFSAELVDVVGKEFTDAIVEVELMHRTLEECLRKLSARDRELIVARYAPEGSVRRLAERAHATAREISRSLYRVRRMLFRCVNASLPTEENS
jgi:RNA polymerase sigma-70 factor (ECF subfamily)